MSPARSGVQQPSQADSWPAYLLSTVFSPTYGPLLLGPSVLIVVVAMAMYDLSWAQALLLGWAWIHLADSLVILYRPAEFGLKLWFPPIAVRGWQGDQAALAVARLIAMFDILFGACRALAALFPSSAPVVGLALLTTVIQFWTFAQEYRHGNTDSRAALIGCFGAVIVGGVLLYVGLTDQLYLAH